jgi:hypothetical protein
VAGEKLAKAILSWLSPADPWKDHSVACELRHKGTGEWFAQGNRFSEWRTSSPGSLLLIQGKRSLFPGFYAFSETNNPLSCSGCRKENTLVCKLSVFPSWELITLVSSAIIQDIDAMRKAGLASLVIFYFDSRDDQKKDRRGLLSSLLVQLCHQSDSIRKTSLSLSAFCRF